MNTENKKYIDEVVRTWKYRKNYICVIVGMDKDKNGIYSHYCGYVGVPKKHCLNRVDGNLALLKSTKPLFEIKGEKYYSLKKEIYLFGIINPPRPLTFKGIFKEEEGDNPDFKDVWFLGFSCLHGGLGDIINPKHISFDRSRVFNKEDAHFWTEDEVKKGVKKFAKQLYLFNKQNKIR